jgi:hypothetical protein
MYNNNSAIAMTDVTKLDKKLQCSRRYTSILMEFLCPNEILLDHIEIDDLNSTILESIESLTIKGNHGTSGPLITIPSNICRFIKLKVCNKNIFD